MRYKTAQIHACAGQTLKHARLLNQTKLCKKPRPVGFGYRNIGLTI